MFYVLYRDGINKKKIIISPSGIKSLPYFQFNVNFHCQQLIIDVQCIMDEETLVPKTVSE